MDPSFWWVRLPLTLLFILSFGLSTAISWNLHNEELRMLFKLNISIFCIPYIITYCFTLFLVLTDLSSNPEPSTPFASILKYLTCGQVNIQNSEYHVYCASSQNSCIIIINYIITTILVFIFVILSPLISIFGMLYMTQRDGRFGITLFYQVLIVICNIIMHTVLLCIHSEIQSTNLLSMLAFVISVCYLLVAIFVYFLRKYHDLIIHNFLPFVMSIELLLAVNMIFMTFMVNYQEYSFYWFCTRLAFVNWIFPNIPFLKSYLVKMYMDWVQSSEDFKFVILESKNREEVIDKMYCILHVISHENCPQNVNLNDPLEYIHENASTQCYRMQYRYLSLAVNDRANYVNSLVENYSQSKSPSFGLRFIQISYLTSSIIAYSFPLLWLVFLPLITLIIDGESYIDVTDYNHLFILFTNSFYVMFIINTICDVIHYMDLSVSSVQMINKLNKIDNLIKDTEREFDFEEMMYDRMAAVKVILNNLQLDIGLTVMSFLFDHDCLDINQ